MAPDPFADVEVMGQEPTESLSDRIWPWLRAHPLVLVPLVLLALAAGGLAALHEVRGPRLPRVSVVADLVAPPAGSTGSGPAWQAGHDNRPTGPVAVSVLATVRQAGPSGGTSDPGGDSGKNATSVLGIAGPGVVTSDVPVARLVPGRPVEMSLRAVLRCAALPATTSPADYRLRTRTQSGSRTRTGLVDAGASAERWQAMIRLACDSWSARRDLTASALTATVDPTRPRMAIAVTLTNSGARPITVDLAKAGPAIRVTGPLPIRVPAHGSTQASLSVVLDGCNSVSAPVDDTARLGRGPRLTTLINLVGLAGTAPFPVGNGSEPDGNGLGPTGIVLAPPAEQSLRTALSSACGLIDPPLTTVASGPSVQIDPATGEISVPVRIDVAAGRVSSLRLDAAPDKVGENTYRVLWKPMTSLVPDPAGVVRTTLRYAMPKSGACPGFGGSLPHFFVTVTVPISGGVRTVRYEQTLDLGADPTAIQVLCQVVGGADGQARSAATRSGPILPTGSG